MVPMCPYCELKSVLGGKGCVSSVCWSSVLVGTVAFGHCLVHLPLLSLYSSTLITVWKYDMNNFFYIYAILTGTLYYDFCIDCCVVSMFSSSPVSLCYCSLVNAVVFVTNSS